TFQKRIQTTLDKIDRVHKQVFTPKVKAAITIGKGVFDHVQGFVTQIAYLSQNAGFMHRVTCFNFATAVIEAPLLPGLTIYNSAKAIKDLYQAIKEGNKEQAVDSVFDLTSVTARVVNTVGSIGRGLLKLQVIGAQNLYWLTVLGGV